MVCRHRCEAGAGCAAGSSQGAVQISSALRIRRLCIDRVEGVAIPHEASGRQRCTGNTVTPRKSRCSHQRHTAGFCYFRPSMYQPKLDCGGLESLAAFDGAGPAGVGAETGQYGRPLGRAVTGHGSCETLMAHWRPYGRPDWQRSRSQTVSLPIKPSQTYHSH